jgi:hypothetical protein
MMCRFVAVVVVVRISVLDTTTPMSFSESHKMTAGVVVPYKVPTQNALKSKVKASSRQKRAKSTNIFYGFTGVLPVVLVLSLHTTSIIRMAFSIS